MQNKKLITHNGSFHADDVFACATLSLMLEKENINFEIIRTRDKEIIQKGDYVFDVGDIYNEDKNRFDHHQVGGAGQRDNGIEYSSFGLIWKKFGMKLCDSRKVVDIIDRKLVAPIDAADNGFDLVENKHEISPYFLQQIFFTMHPTWKEDDLNKDKIFLKAVDIAKTILSREIVQAQDMVSAEETVTSIYNETKDKRMIVLDQNYPFEYILYNFPEPLFAIYPRKTDNSWGVKAIRKDFKTFDNRKDLPESWAGQRDKEFQEITGVPDAMFCHRGLFFAGAKSKEGAVKLAQIAIES